MQLYKIYPLPQPITQNKANIILSNVQYVAINEENYALVTWGLLDRLDCRQAGLNASFTIEICDVEKISKPEHDKQCLIKSIDQDPSAINYCMYKQIKKTTGMVHTNF